MTCHRVELYGPRIELEDFAAVSGWATRRRLSGTALARHVIRLAVGRESAVIAEDQIVHQLRVALADARRRGPLPHELERLFEVALRAGRRARSWLPARRPGLIDAALARVAGGVAAAMGRVLVVGAGEMGTLAAEAARARGADLVVASRTPERARALAEHTGGVTTPFDGSATAFEDLTGVVVALAGQWPLGDAARSAVVASEAWVIDLSSPPALDDGLAARLAGRLTSIDDLAGTSAEQPSAELVKRLDRLADEALADYIAWMQRSVQRDAAHALQERASSLRSAELERLAHRLPGLSGRERDEVARALARVTDTLLRDPLERLGEDGDGRHARAAHELFRL